MSIVFRKIHLFFTFFDALFINPLRESLTYLLICGIIIWIYRFYLKRIIKLWQNTEQEELTTRLET